MAEAEEPPKEVAAAESAEAATTADADAAAAATKAEAEAEATAAADKEPKLTIAGKDYKFLADGKYDVIICGTGTTECILSGLCATSKKKVLHIDRNDFYGAKAASLNLT